MKYKAGDKIVYTFRGGSPHLGSVVSVEMRGEVTSVFGKHCALELMAQDGQLLRLTVKQSDPNLRHAGGEA